MPILIYLPPGYSDSQRCYPVVYLLHGYGGPYTEWEKWGLTEKIDPMIRSGKIQPMIAVMPEGERSYWFNHWPVPTPQNDGLPWGDYIWKDVVGYVDANYRTLTRRESRAIGGLSSGGQGALMLGMTHPDEFGIVGAHSPSFREADGSLEFFGKQDYFNQYDPIWLVKNTDTAKQLTIWMDVGEDDDVWGEGILRYKKLLESLKIPFEFHTSPGRHEGSYWVPHVPDYLTWYASKLAGQ
jgi:enterochelin esterase-like enzyme